MNFSTLQISVYKKAAVITLNRPEKLNALNTTLFKELDEAIENLNRDENIRSIIITGAGEKAFAAGADITELQELDTISGREFSERGQKIFDAIENSRKPIIAAINGYALGGGFELALACHIRIAAETAMFGFPEITLGVIPGYGGTQRLTKLINKGRAFEYILTGDRISVDESYRLGIVSHIYPAAKLMEEALALGDKIAEKSMIITAFAIDALTSANNVTLKEGLSIEAGLFGLCCNTKDFKEGTTAFLEKRKPQFTDK